MKSASVKLFNKYNCGIPGADIYDTPVYQDHRGSLCESFHCLKMPAKCSIESVYGFYPHIKTMYGPMEYSGEEYVYVIRGRVRYFIADRESQKQICVDVFPGKILYLSNNVIRAFYSLESDTMLEIMKSSYSGPNILYSLKSKDFSFNYDLDVSSFEQSSLFPEPPERILRNRQNDFVIFGADTMIGKAFIRELDHRGYSWHAIHADFTQHEAVYNELVSVRPRISVIVADGSSVYPNTASCESNKESTTDRNLTCQLAVVRMCLSLKLHCTICGSPGMYHYDEKHTLENKVGFTEEDRANHAPNFFYKMGRLKEQMLEETGAISKVLNLRVFYAMDHTMEPTSLLTKLMKYEVVRSIQGSHTVLNDLVPLAIEMMTDGETGHVNWVCDGTVTNGDIMRMYQKIVDPKFRFKEVVVTPEESKRLGDMAAYVVPARMLKKFGSRVPKVLDSMERVMNVVLKSVEDV